MIWFIIYYASDDLSINISTHVRDIWWKFIELFAFNQKNRWFNGPLMRGLLDFMDFGIWRMFMWDCWGELMDSMGWTLLKFIGSWSTSGTKCSFKWEWMIFDDGIEWLNMINMVAKNDHVFTTGDHTMQRITGWLAVDGNGCTIFRHTQYTLRMSTGYGLFIGYTILVWVMGLANRLVTVGNNPHQPVRFGDITQFWSPKKTPRLIWVPLVVDGYTMLPLNTDIA